MRTVLLIEDDRILADILGEAVEAEGFQCLVHYAAGDAEAEFSRLGTEIAAVILDLMMTRSGTFAKAPPSACETGDEIYERIRKLAPTLPVIIITAKRKESLMTRYATDKYAHVFYKPIDEDASNRIISIIKKL